MSELWLKQGMLGKDLAGFKIVEATGVCKKDTEGSLTNEVVGLFEDPALADAYVETIAGWGDYGTMLVLVLTDGKIAFVVNQQQAVDVFDDADMTTKVKAAATEALSPAVRKILGLS